MDVIVCVFSGSSLAGLRGELPALGGVPMTGRLRDAAPSPLKTNRSPSSLASSKGRPYDRFKHSTRSVTDNDTRRMTCHLGGSKRQQQSHSASAGNVESACTRAKDSCLHDYLSLRLPRLTLFLSPFALTRVCCGRRFALHCIFLLQTILVAGARCASLLRASVLSPKPRDSCSSSLPQGHWTMRAE